MRFIGAILLLSGAAFPQLNVRGTNEGTNEYRVAPLEIEPKPAWDIKTGYRDGTSMLIAGGVLVTGNPNGRRGIFAYDAATGRRMWSIPRHIRGEPATDGTAAYAVNDADRNQFRLIKIELKTGRVLWATQEEDLGNHNGGPLVADGRVFLSSRNRKLSAYDAATGKAVWEHSATEACSPSLAYSGGRLYFSGGLAGSAGKLTALDAATGSVQWSATQKSDHVVDCTSPAVVSGGMVITPVGHEVFAFDARTGEQKWRQSVTRTENGRTVRPALHELTVAGGVVYTSMKFGIIGWRVGTGQPEFEFAGRHIADSRSLRMAFAGGMLYFLGNAELPPDKDQRGGWIYALHLASKEVRWKHQASKPDRYNPEGSWPTQFVVPVDGGLIYENQGVLVKLTQ